MPRIRVSMGTTPLEELNPSDFALFLSIDDLHRDRLGLVSDEILMLCLNHKDQLQWFYSAIRDRLKKHDRLDRTAVLIVSRDNDIRSKCADSNPDPDLGYIVSFVCFTVTDLIDSLKKIPFNVLEAAFHQQAFTTDHFDTSTPVSGDALFGRRTIISKLEPEYMLPDIGTVKWDGSFDLFAIGMILLKCQA
jgi:hypothetical protein